jgi:hypothetical protein
LVPARVLEFPARCAEADVGVWEYLCHQDAPSPFPATNVRSSERSGREGLVKARTISDHDHSFAGQIQGVWWVTEYHNVAVTPEV